MTITLTTENIDNFITPGKQKYVMKLENNVLSFVPVKKTKWKHRIAAWFGSGPLNLNSIADFISTHRTEINAKLDSQTQCKFYSKLIDKCVSYNGHKHHFYCKVKTTALHALKDTLKENSWATAWTTHQLGATYDTDGSGIVDFSYVNHDLHFGFVADAAGHNEPVMKPVFDDIMNTFIKKYEEALKKQTFKDIQEAGNFVREQMSQLAETIKADRRPIKPEGIGKTGNTLFGYSFGDSSYHPAMSFAQVVNINSQRVLLHVNFADTSLLIRRADGSFNSSLIVKGNNIGVGSAKVDVKGFVVKSGDLIIGFSDGIGEFLTLEECQEVIVATKNPQDLLEGFKKKIIEKGEQFTKEHPTERNRVVDGIESASKATYMKYHDKTAAAYIDDISLFTLPVV